MEWIKTQYHKFYDFFIGSVTPGVKGAVIVVLITLAIMCILSATKGKSDIVFKKWLPLFFAIVFIVFAGLYAYWTK